MTNPVVALTRCPDYAGPKVAEALQRQFALAGGLNKFISPGDSVLIKPNFIAPKLPSCPAQTHPAVIIEIAKLIKDFGAKPFVADSPAWTNVNTCARALGLDGSLKKLSIPLKQLNRPRTCILGKDRTKVGISSIALDADAIINLPKFKSHQQLVATFAVKNMFGCVSGKKKAYWHFAKGGHLADFCELLIEVYEFLNPCLTIIDAVVIMDGPGPINGRSRPLGWLIGGADPIACEYICCEIAGLKSNELPIINTVRKLSFGSHNPDRIEVRGDPLSEAKLADFEQAKLIPIRFTLPRICKSIIKQILLLAKGPRHSHSIDKETLLD